MAQSRTQSDPTTSWHRTMGGDFTVIAIVAARNEADIIAQVIEDLIRQRIQVYLIDDGSTDDTVQEARRWLGQGLLKIETRPQSDVFDWTGLLTRKQELAVSLQGDWFIHHDADEFRESPWPHLDLHDAIHRVDELGYSAIDFRVLNFRPTHDDFVPGQDVRSAFRFFEPAPRWDAIQVKAWKRQAATIDLASSGGHDVTFPDRRVFPVPFLCRHYPIRGQAHGTRKVFSERGGRLVKSELERGWHVHYTDVAVNARFVLDASSLQEYDASAMARELQASSRDTSWRQEAEAAVERLQASLTALATSTDLERRSLQAAILGLQRDLARRNSELEDLRTAMAAERQKAVVQVDAVRSELLAQQEALAARIRAAETEAAAYVLSLGHLRTELRALYASRSWRLTKPLRSIYSTVTGQPENLSDDTTSAVRSRPGSDWGDLARVSPFSQVWGLDRGTAIDRFYIEQFLGDHRADVVGHVLEVKDPGYTRRFGAGGVTRTSILDVDPANPQATVVGDLAGEALDIDEVDCFILTQTVHIIFDAKSALRQAVRVLKPGGVLLCTLPAVSRVNYEDGGLEGGDFWRFTRAAVQRLVQELPDVGDVEIRTWGNVRTCAAFLYGLSVEDLPAEVMALHDPWFPLLHGLRIVKQR